MLIFWGAIAVVALCVWRFTNYRRKQRADAMRRVAEELGLEYSAVSDDAFIESFGLFELFSKGRAKKVFNLMQGTSADRALAIFDYQFVTGHGKSTRTNRTTTLCLRFTGEPLPTFTLRPENLGDKIVRFFRKNDIDFDTHPYFSRMYVLRGDDETAIRGLFTVPLLEYYEARNPLYTEGRDQTLIVYRIGRVSPQEINSLLAEGLELLARLNRAT